MLAFVAEERCHTLDGACEYCVGDALTSLFFFIFDFKNAGRTGLSDQGKLQVQIQCSANVIVVVADFVRCLDHLWAAFLSPPRGISFRLIMGNNWGLHLQNVF